MSSGSRTLQLVMACGAGVQVRLWLTVRGSWEQEVYAASNTANIDFQQERILIPPSV